MKFANARLGRTVFELENVTIKAGPKLLLEDLTWNLGPGERIGLLGVNGAGKTSLLRAMQAAHATQGDVQPASGVIKVGKTVKLAYLSQEIAELDPATRVLQAVEQIRGRVDLGKGREMSAGQLCEQFGFGKDKQWTPVGDLSGGERRRLQLLRLLMDEPNVLFLDEPTNDLDIETLNQLEDLLDGWPGSMVVISHDRFFIERTTDTVHALLGDKRLRMLPNGVDEYLERRARMAEQAVPAALATPAAKPAGDSRAIKKEMQKLERQIVKLDAQEAKLHAQLAEHAADFAKISELDGQLRKVREDKEELELAWMELAEQE